MLNSILNEQFWFMESNFLQNFLDSVHSKDIGEALKDEQAIAIIVEPDEDKDKKPYAVDNGIATIKIHGPLMKRASGFFAWLFGIRGMEAIGKDIETALEDKDVKGIMLDIDSPGGSVDGTAALADIVYNARGKKPVMTFADGSITSAAYWIGSGADYIALSDPTTKSGSIGVVGVHQEISEMAKKIGVGIHVFSAGKFKKSGNMFEKLSKEDIKYIDGQFKYLHNLFIEGISKNLGTPKSKIPSDVKEAKVFFGQEGVDAGLADAILTRSEAMSKLRAVIDGKDKFNKKSMIKAKGGENKMDLEAKIKQLEESLKVANEQILAFNSDKVTKELNGKIEALESENAELKTDHDTKIQALETTIVTLKEEKAGLTTLSEIGKQAVDKLKADIMVLSVKAKGADHNEAYVKKELEAFGNDFDHLVHMKADLEKTISKLFKTGDLNQDDQKTDADKSAEDYEIGQAVGRANLRMVQPKK